MKPAVSRLVELCQSKLYRMVVVGIHLAAAVAVATAQLDRWFAAVLLCTVLLSLARQKRSLECEGLVLRSVGTFEIVGAGDTAYVLYRGSVKIGPLAVLRYRDSDRVRSLVLLPDSFVKPDDWRYFCRWLRWQATTDD
jgi:hypothetical protein